MSNKCRILYASVASSILIVLLCMMYMAGHSSDTLGNVTYYATRVDTVLGYVWRDVKARIYTPYNKHIDTDAATPVEIESCISSHPINGTFMKHQENIQKSRREALNKNCQKYYNMDTDGKHQPDVSLLVENYRLVYAQTAKIAGTSWDRVFLVLSHLANSTSQFSQSKSIDKTFEHVPRLTNYIRKDRQYILQNFTTFMFSRHPFSRLLSAYSCKVGPEATEEHVKRGFYDHLRKQILKRYPTTITNKRGIPDFRGFVQYIVQNDYFQDPHWKENYKVVSPCDVHYDIIGHFETLDDDARYILQSVGADCLVEFPSSKGSAATNSSQDDTLVENFQTLSRELIEKLYQRYRLDFLLFGYTFEINIDGQFLRFPPDGN